MLQAQGSDVAALLSGYSNTCLNLNHNPKLNSDLTHPTPNTYCNPKF